MRKHRLIATMLGVGYFPVAPGTAGSMAGVVILFLTNMFLHYLGGAQPAILLINVAMTLIVFFIGAYSIKKLETIWEHDASKIVIDEVIGVWIAAYALPPHWKYYLAALLLFRFFDIVKPMFIKRIDVMQNHWSVMLDDVLAGIYSSIMLQCLILFNLF
ncbi:MAG: phosphatidylglycerophosphatase A [Bacteroidales bacterium]|nr:phosphatidylglycerophosphatase A [Bacteroidales bacterium]